jgi:hypothetical protein
MHPVLCFNELPLLLDGSDGDGIPGLLDPVRAPVGGHHPGLCRGEHATHVRVFREVRGEIHPSPTAYINHNNSNKKLLV